MQMWKWNLCISSMKHLHTIGCNNYDMVEMATLYSETWLSLQFHLRRCLMLLLLTVSGMQKIADSLYSSVACLLDAINKLQTHWRAYWSFTWSRNFADFAVSFSSLSASVGCVGVQVYSSACARVCACTPVLMCYCYGFSCFYNKLTHCHFKEVNTTLSFFFSFFFHSSIWPPLVAKLKQLLLSFHTSKTSQTHTGRRGLGWNWSNKNPFVLVCIGPLIITLFNTWL